MWFVSFCSLVALAWWPGGVVSRDDGLALRPPMGWLSWTRFQCQMDCAKYPNHCVSEDLYKSMAREMVDGGYLAAGYNYLNVDDCWSERARDDQGRLQASRERFPSGIKALSDYVHSLRLQFGLYATFGKRTCMGFAGTFTQREMQVDARSMLEWNVDYLKFDGCFNDPKDLNDGYISMAKYLNETGRPIVYSCSWPYYLLIDGKIDPDYDVISNHCHLWRNYHDITITWQAILAIINFYDSNQDKLAKHHGPGRWNDPDMLIVGNRELSERHSRVQMVMWCMWSAPLLMSNDLRSVPDFARSLLLNPWLIAIDQDAKGDMARRWDMVDFIVRCNVAGVYVKLHAPAQSFRKQMNFAILNTHQDVQLLFKGLDEHETRLSLRVYKKLLAGGKSFAYAFLNPLPDTTVRTTFKFSELQLAPVAGGYSVLNLVTGKLHAKVVTDSIQISVPAEDIVAYKLIAPDDDQNERNLYLLSRRSTLTFSMLNQMLLLAVAIFFVMWCKLPKRYHPRIFALVFGIFCLYSLLAFKLFSFGV